MSGLALADLQSAFRNVCLGRDAPELAALVDGARIAADARLRIYRHHVFDSLSTALAATFSTVHALVGEGFFRALARDYIAVAPPAVPVLSEYGADFADFIERHARTGELVYLADAARLDWALTRAYGADAGMALTAAHLAAMAPEALGDLRPRVRAGVSLLRSAWPIDQIWAVSHGAVLPQPGNNRSATCRTTARGGCPANRAPPSTTAMSSTRPATPTRQPVMAARWSVQKAPAGVW